MTIHESAGQPSPYYIRAYGGVISELPRSHVGGMVTEITAEFGDDVTESVIDLGEQFQIVARLGLRHQSNLYALLGVLEGVSELFQLFVHRALGC